MSIAEKGGEAYYKKVLTENHLFNISLEILACGIGAGNWFTQLRVHSLMFVQVE
jgi:hypothetical protein